MLKEPLNIWLKDVIEDKIIISSNIIDEAEKNKWSFSLGVNEAKNLTENDLIDFFNKIILKRKLQLKEIKQQMFFYLWFDEFAGNLCFSLVKYNEECKLPFTIEIIIVNDLNIIISEFLESKYLEGIPYNELKDIPDKAEDNVVEDTKLNVFCIKIP